MQYFTIKALHLIFVVTWFAGLFYVVRLFVYHDEANKKDEPAKGILTRQFKLMEKRLWYGITWPSMILSTVFGVWMLVLNPALLKQPFMHVKLVLLVGLIFYHFSCHVIVSQLQKDLVKYSSFKMRIWNEVATLFLVSIVFVIVLKSAMNWIWGVVGFFLLGIILMTAIKLYKRAREK